MLFFPPLPSFADPPSSAGDFSHIRLKPVGISSSAECGQCHKDIYKTWQNSLHAQASGNLVFRTAYLQAYFKKGESARRTCLACHAPVARVNGDYELTDPLTREGINCDYCHNISSVKEDASGFTYTHEFGAVKQGPLKDVSSPVHLTRHNSLYKKSIICAACHEYESRNGVRLIETFSEWRDGPYPKKGIHCQDCHMRKVPGKIVSEKVKRTPEMEISTHDIAGGHSLAMREKSLTLKIEDIQVHKQRVQVTVGLTNKGAGHKIPTGLPSKKILLQVSVKSKSEGVAQTQQKIYQKIVVDGDGNPVTSDADLLLGNGQRVISDNRIGPLETVRESFTFFVPEEKEQTVSATVFYSHNPEVIQPSPIHIKMNEVTQVLER